MLTPALALVVVATLSGCLTPPDPAPTTPPPTAAAPLFATEEEALAAAEEVYLAYGATSDLIASEGGVNPERLEPFVVPSLYQKDVQSFESFATHGLRQLGSIENTDFQLIEYLDFGDGTASLWASACASYLDVKFVDASGLEVTSGNRPDRLLLDLKLLHDGGGFRVSELDKAEGEATC